MPPAPGPRWPVSVVLPFRNARPWLARTLAALVAHGGVPFELVAVDDGSSDGGSLLLRRLTANWPAESVQLLQTGGIGVSAARNRAVAAARAPVIAFLDADDPPLPGRLSAPLSLLEQRPELHHVMGGWKRVDPQGRELGHVQPWMEGAGFSLRQAYGFKAVLPSAWTLRRRVFEAVGGFDPSLRHAEDVDLLIRIAAERYAGDWVRQPLVNYRIHPQGATRQWRQQIDVILDVMERSLPRLPADQRSWGLETSYYTALWCVWKIWCETHWAQCNGDQSLHTALQQGGLAHVLSVLQRTRAYCTLPLARRLPHFLETLARTARFEGMPFDCHQFRVSPLFRQVAAVIAAP